LKTGDAADDDAGSPGPRELIDEGDAVPPSLDSVARPSKSWSTRVRLFWRAREIAGEESLPPRLLDLILGELRQVGPVESVRGLHGRFRLLPVADTMSILDVL
jgi:hypothetical protein